MQHLTVQAMLKWNTIDWRKTDNRMESQSIQLTVQARPQHRKMCQQVCLIGFNS